MSYDHYLCGFVFGRGMLDQAAMPSANETEQLAAFALGVQDGAETPALVAPRVKVAGRVSPLLWGPK